MEDGDLGSNTEWRTDPKVTERGPVIATKCAVEETPGVASIPSDSHNSPQ